MTAMSIAGSVIEPIAPDPREPVRLAGLDWLVYPDPLSAIHAATVLEHMTGDRCIVASHGLRYRIVRLDASGREAGAGERAGAALLNPVNEIDQAVRE